MALSFIPCCAVMVSVIWSSNTFLTKRKTGLKRKQNKYSDYVVERKVKGVD